VSQPVKVSDTLLMDARLAGKAMERSIAGQIEFWAKLGRAVEPLLHGDRVLALCRAGEALSLSEQLATVDTAAGRRRVVDHLKTLPYPHYEAVPGMRGLLARIDAGGRRTVGRFVNREFKVVKAASGRKMKPVSAASRG
jgi:hypothetical protein